MRTSVDVHNYLVERDVPHELFATRGRLRTPERIAAVLDLPPRQVGRVVVFESDKGPVVALVASDREVDPDRLARAVGAGELKPATATRASQLAEYLHEAIPPVGLPNRFHVVLDRPLAGRPVLYFHGGDASAVLKIRGKDLERAAGAAVARISR